MQPAIIGLAKFKQGAGNPIDQLVGENVKRRRTRQNLSQSELARHLGITFQQVQKYEKGTNRIGAGRLFLISRILECELDELYEGADELVGNEGAERAGQSRALRISEFVGTRAGGRLCDAASQLEPSVLASLVGFARALVHQSDEDD